MQRETPPEGITLPNGTYIPGNIIVWMPIHCLQRDPRYFARPLQFMPERWTGEQPNAVIDKRAFMPFGTGVYNCVGQKLAMMEEAKTLPFGDVWDELCRQADVPVGRAWISELDAYEQNVLAAR